MSTDPDNTVLAYMLSEHQPHPDDPSTYMPILDRWELTGRIGGRYEDLLHARTGDGGSFSTCSVHICDIDRGAMFRQHREFRRLEVDAWYDRVMAALHSASYNPASLTLVELWGISGRNAVNSREAAIKKILERAPRPPGFDSTSATPEIWIADADVFRCDVIFSADVFYGFVSSNETYLSWQASITRLIDAQPKDHWLTILELDELTD